MTWLQTGPMFIVTLLVFFAPGLAILASAGVRGLNLLSLAAPVSFTVASVLAILLGIIRAPLNPVTYFATSAAFAILAFLTRLALRRRAGSSISGFAFGVLGANGPIPLPKSRSWSGPLIVLAAVCFPALIITYRYLKGFGSPDSLSQTFDNVYHLNAVRFIADHQMGSSLRLGNLTEASAGFYPAAMHDLMALAFMMGGTSIMEAVNVGTVVIGALIWPLSCIFLVTRIVGNRPIAILVTGVLSAGFSAFPYLMVAFGVLYPNHAAIALLPAVLGLVIELLGLSQNRPSSFWPPLLALAVVGPGLALAHPSAIVALVGFSAPLVIARLIRSWIAFRRGAESKKQFTLWIAFALGYFAASAVIWIKVRPSLAAAPWTPFQSNARALGEVLASAPMGTTAAWVMLLCTVIGIYVIARRLRQFWWVLGMYLVGAGLYIIVSAWGVGNFRTFWTGVWYNDSFRLAALLPTVTLPVAVIGAEWLVFRIRAFCDFLVANGREDPHCVPKALRSLSARLPQSTGILAAAATILVLGIGVQGGTLSNVQQRLDTIFVTNDQSYLLTTDETDLLSAVANLVPADEIIVANPRTGGSLAYAIADRKTLAPHIFGERTPEEQYLLDHWDEAAYNNKVCPIIRDLKAYWALDFGDFEVVPGDTPFTGLKSLTDGTAPGMEIVKTVGKVHLYRVTVCD